ncbi:hypothetical protein [Paraburkholderia monticola]|uniref:hypothetical protein n=1 Tax=Paraburkholderia monticola TaxID=1399968 RepID=UPI00137A61D6|nr:hypothetical protein [Paraburkholderia monticola]
MAVKLPKSTVKHFLFVALQKVSILASLESAPVPSIDDPVLRGIEIRLSHTQQGFEPKKQHIGIVVSKSASGIVACHEIEARNLAALGFDVQWGDIPAAALGANHLRNRIWIVAHPKGQQGFCESNRREIEKRLHHNENPWKADPWDEAESKIHRVDDGIPDRVDRTERLGNAQVPLVAATAWNLLSGG